MKRILALLYLMSIVSYVVLQDCVPYGKRCAGVGQCCGGCCFEGACIDTYRSCSELRNPCIDHYCPAGSECVIFKSENCPECEIQAICEFKGEIY